MTNTLRQMGVEEEMFLVDPGTGRLKPVSERALSADEASAEDDEGVEQELFLDQIETTTEPGAHRDEVREHVLAARARAARAAHAAGAALMASGTAVLAHDGHDLTPKDRYRRMLDGFGAIGRQAGVCGMHVHVDVVSDAEAVRVVDGLRPWLPLLVALSANSPFDHGQDTGYASWRGQVWDAWPSAGPVEPFGSVEAYRWSVKQMVAAGAAIDEGMVYLDARLARDFPTVELRVADVCTDVEDVVLLAVLSRALVETVAGSDAPTPNPWRVEMLRAARWNARRHGVDETLLDPMTAELVPAEQAMATLLHHLSPALQRADDLGFARDGIERLQHTGGGARRQREAAGDGDLTHVVRDLVARTAPGA